MNYFEAKRKNEILQGYRTRTAELEKQHAALLDACKYVVKWHRGHDSGEGELFGLDFVTTCIAAIAKATN